MSIPANPGDSLSRKRKLLYILLLGALTALGPFTIDLYLPAFPALEASLGVSEAEVQLTLTGTTVGFEEHDLSRVDAEDLRRAQVRLGERLGLAELAGSTNASSDWTPGGSRRTPCRRCQRRRW